MWRSPRRLQRATGGQQRVRRRILWRVRQTERRWPKSRLRRTPMLMADIQNDPQLLADGTEARSACSSLLRCGCSPCIVTRQRSLVGSVHTHTQLLMTAQEAAASPQEEKEIRDAVAAGPGTKKVKFQGREITARVVCEDSSDTIYIGFDKK